MLGARKEDSMANVKFGSNTFSAGREFTIVGIDESNNLIMGGFGPRPKKPLVWITFKGEDAYLNAELGDVDGEIVLAIEENVITINKDNVYKVEHLPANQIPPNQVIVTNKYGETAMDLRREGNIWDFNGDFYHGRWHVVATPGGTTINPGTPRV